MVLASSNGTLTDADIGRTDFPTYHCPPQQHFAAFSQRVIGEGELEEHSLINMPKQQFHQEPFVHAAGRLGYLEGLTISHQTNGARNKPLLQYFGGIPYALSTLR